MKTKSLSGLAQARIQCQKKFNQIIFSKGGKENEVDAHKYINSSIAID